MAVVTTGILTIVPHFGFIWAALGIVIGSLLGSIFMASHSAQGPHLGIPQMIQSRAQFGYYGAVIPLFMVVAMYLGFYAAGAVIGAEALALLSYSYLHGDSHQFCSRPSLGDWRISVYPPLQPYDGLFLLVGFPRRQFFADMGTGPGPGIKPRYVLRPFHGRTVSLKHFPGRH